MEMHPASAIFPRSLHLLPRFARFNHCCFVPTPSPISPKPRLLAIKPISAAASAILEPESINLKTEVQDSDPFACPICFQPLQRKGPTGFTMSAIYRSGFMCASCRRTYSSKENFLDLTIESGTKKFTEVRPNGTELFRSPVVSFLYERGWRQNFAQSGFPGPDEEFKMAQEYFKPSLGGILLDVSCGSGLFSRKFAKSDAYSKVIALDFSENMLRQCYDFIRQDRELLTRNVALVRADVSRLPFPSSSIDAVHAGAALHCWPSPSNAIAEICRVLKSGGVFVGTTFLRRASPLERWAARGSYNYFSEAEIEDLCKACGLSNYSKKVDKSFIIFSAQKN